MSKRADDGGAEGEDAREILEGMRRVVQALRVSSRRAERAVELSGAQLFVLQKLAEREGMSMNELAERTFTHQSSVSVVVARLAERGMVRRGKSEADGRKSELAITAAGRKALGRAPELAQDRLVAAIGAMGAAGRRGLREGLAELVERAGMGGGTAELFFEERGKRKRDEP